MFCDEVIKRVYERRAREEAGKHCDAYLQLEGDLEYHVTDGYWLIFEAEHHAISLGADGVRLWDSLQEAAPNSGELEDMSDAEYWVHPEHTLFVGEHIQDVHRSDRLQTVLCMQNC